MNKSNKDHYKKWISLIKSDNIEDVIFDIEGNKLDAIKSLDCIVAIGQLAYDHVKNAKEFKSLPEHVVKLTEWLSSIYCLEPPKSTLRYLTCIYHILNVLLKKNHLDHMVTTFKTVIKFKQMHLKTYEDDAETLHHPLACLLKEAVLKVVSVENAPVNWTLLSTLFSLFFEIGIEIKTLSSEKILLESILQAAQVLSKKYEKETSEKVTMCLNTGLNVIYERKTTIRLGASLDLLFKIFSFLFCAQKKISNHHLSLATLKSHLDNATWKCSGNVHQDECFLLACNSVTILMGDCPENIMLKKIQENSDILNTISNSQNYEVIKTACSFVIYIVAFPRGNDSKSISMIPESCLESFALMILDFCTVLQDSSCLKLDDLNALTEICILLSSDIYDKQFLKRCIGLVLKIEKCIERNFNELRTKSYPNTNVVTSKILARYANLIRTYHIEELSEEVITIAKPFCKFIYTLPSDIFEISQNVKSLDLCFICLVNALSSQRLGQALECLVVWITKCPQNSLQAFKVWGDIKHNSVCAGRDDDLEMNVWTIINERKSDVEKEWCCTLNLSTAEVGDFLIQELQIYFENRALRGKPLISAANALLDLNVDCLTKVKGLVIAMDIASANPDFAELCTTYYNKSKLLATKLRKEKKNFDPVAFNFCLGDLLYAQLRCQLKYLRTNCENEMVKLSKSPMKPLVAELPENQPDPNDSCDITPRYHHLSLDQQRKLMDSMDSAIRHWGFACGMLKDVCKAKLDLKVTMTSLKGAGLLLKLYCDETKESKVWNILYEIALMMEDINMTVWAVGQLMTTNANVAPDIISKIETMMLNNSDLKETTTVSYKLNSAFSSLKKNKIPEGLASLKTVEKAEKKNDIQTSQFYSIIGQFQSLSDWENYNHSFDSCPSFHFSLHLSLRRLLFQVKEKKWGSFGELCEQQKELMVVSYLMGEANWGLEQPREARSYLKIVFPIAQKLALPLRTVQLLLLLAWIDLNTGLKDDCAVKLEGLEDLLELCGTPVVYGQSVESPSVNKSVISVPDYLFHSPACHCLPCTTVEYRRLVLETLTLRATFCTAFGTQQDAAQSFQVAKQVEEELRNTNVCEVYKSRARMWLRYAGFKASLCEHHEAITANDKASQLLTFVRDPISLQQAAEQKLGLLCSLHQFKITPIKAKVVIEARKTVSSESSTPISKRSKAPENSPLATINNNVKSVTPFARPVRPFRIPSSGAENTPVPASKTKRKTRLPPKFVCDETPENIRKVGNSSVKQFVIVDDDGIPVGISGTKTLSRMRNKMSDMESDLQHVKSSSKKMLFSSATNTNVKSDLSSVTKASDEPHITRMTRKPELKTYRNSKLTSKKAATQSTSKCAPNENEDHSKEGPNKNMFSFDQMKDSLSEIHHVKSKPVTEVLSDKKITRKLSSKKAATQSTSKFETTKQNENHSTVGINGNVFSFDQMKDSLSETDHLKSKPVTEVKSGKKTNSLLSKKQAIKSDTSQLTSRKDDLHKTKDIQSDKKYSIDSNCDLIEGTPPTCQKASVSLIPKRITRSYKT